MLVYALAMLLLIPAVALPRYFLKTGSTAWFGVPVAGSLMVVLLSSAAVLAAIFSIEGEPSFLHHSFVVVLSTLVAAVGGGPVTEVVFALAARRPHPNISRSRSGAEESLLRGGMWIGILERIAIAATLWASWPEGLAVVLAVKGLGRFAELKQHAAAEQFILGTFSSVLWACAAYGVGLLLIG